MAEADKIEELVRALIYVSPDCNNMHDAEWRHVQAAFLRSLSTKLTDLQEAKEALEWVEKNLLEPHWDGTIGRPRTWQIRGPYRHELIKLRGATLTEAVSNLQKRLGKEG